MNRPLKHKLSGLNPVESFEETIYAQMLFPFRWNVFRKIIPIVTRGLNPQIEFGAIISI